LIGIKFKLTELIIEISYLTLLCRLL